jgi:hypothetical protein
MSAQDSPDVRQRLEVGNVPDVAGVWVGAERWVRREQERRCTDHRAG